MLWVVSNGTIFCEGNIQQVLSPGQKDKATGVVTVCASCAKMCRTPIHIAKAEPMEIKPLSEQDEHLKRPTV